ncbi:MAG: hypothetical protein AAF437_06830 [Pseudomonadota bacterium]
MSKTARFWLIAGAAFLVCSGLVLLTAYSVGADPLHPRSRHIWALSLIAAAYASIRLSMIAGKFLDARENADGDAPFSGIPLIGKKEHAIDRRLAERRARVEAAKKRANETDEVNKEPGDE